VMGTDDEQQLPVIDPADFRKVLGHLPTGVTVVAAAPDEHPAGMTIGSFFSVSLDPPLVGFCAGKGSTSWPLIEPARCFAVNILSSDQAGISNHFASSAADRFGEVSWRPGVTGSPILDGVVGHIECRTEHTFDAGDHWIVVGHVVDLSVDEGGAPLVFLGGRYGTFEEVL
jgi:3-hydroxy-9,10-secoandrosta-1,3,5(10)-triene-9,17-dione monooxygenase reductase component